MNKQNRGGSMKGKLYKERTNQGQGKKGGKVPCKVGPVGSRVLPGNATKKGGVFRPTKGKP